MASTLQPWTWLDTDTIENYVEHIVNLALLPTNFETAFDDPVLTTATSSLAHTSLCTICNLLHTLTEAENPNVAFYEDYAILCFTCLHAPHAWTSNFMAAIGFHKLIAQYFPSAKTPEITGLDAMLHFFTKKCFVTVASDSVEHRSSLKFITLEFLRGTLTGNLSSTFSFKSTWHILDSSRSITRKASSPCCEHASTKPEAGPSKIQEKTWHLAEYYQKSQPKADLLWKVLSIWQGTQLLNLQTWEHLRPYLAEPLSWPEERDAAQGPCLMSTAMGLKEKNSTKSICILCECLAAHSLAKDALAALRKELLSVANNNSGILDRIPLVLTDSAALDSITDPLLKAVIASCSPQQIHKHLFWDPLCQHNARITCPTVLFTWPQAEAAAKLKAALATGLHLQGNSLFNCPTLETLSLIFKATQLCRVGKTTLLEIIKEMDITNQVHFRGAPPCYQAANVYV